MNSQFKQLLVLELQDSFKETILSKFWLIVEPILFTLVYVFVFAVILGSRETGIEGINYPEFLVIGLWPWLVFSRSVAGSVGLIQQKASLIKKLNIKSELFLYARTTAQFIIYTSTFFVVLMVLSLMGVSIKASGLIIILPVFLILWVFTNGIALIVASLAVFIDDLRIVVPLFITLAFFLMPIIWPAHLLSEDLSFLVDYNPLAGILTYLRAALLQGELIPSGGQYYFPVISIMVFSIGSLLYKKLSRYFLDVI